MYKKILLFLFLFPMIIFAEDRGVASFPSLGFSIDTFKIKDMPNNEPIINIFLPASEEFASNVNVLIQKFNGSLSQYREITESQFKNEGRKAIISKIENKKYTLEYEGDYNNKKLLELRINGDRYESANFDWNRFAIEGQTYVNEFRRTHR